MGPLLALLVAVDGGGSESGMFMNLNSGCRDIMSLRIKRLFYLVT